MSFCACFDTMISMKENYDVVMEKQIAAMGEGKKLLLHACCAPCSAGCIDRLSPHFDVTFFFYNPNIDSRAEYEKRAEELERFARSYVPAASVVVADYAPEEFFDAARGLEKEPERGARCEKCFCLRLQKTRDHAAQNGFDCFATTLTLSPLKNAALINAIGLSLDSPQTRYLCSDFKKRGGNVRSKELCERFSLYRQNFCGCVFSKKDI